MRPMTLVLALLALTACERAPLTAPATPEEVSPRAAPLFDVGGNPNAPPSRITRGDAEAVFDAFGTAGYLIVNKKGRVAVPAAPGDFHGDKGVISPLPYLDGHHYCRLDWLVPVLSIFYGDPTGPQRSPSEIRAELDRSSAAFRIDGQPFPTRRTPVKPWNEQRLIQGVKNTFGYSTGELVAPRGFSVGSHMLHVDIDIDGALIASLEGTFYVDAAESATCTG